MLASSGNRMFTAFCSSMPLPTFASFGFPRLTAYTVALAGALYLGIAAGCCHHVNQNSPSAPRRDINAVLADHDKELMAIPGVVGVYVGLMKDEKTPCLKVMLVRKDASLERQIPRTLEGYRVVTEVTGEIRPLK